MVDPSFDPTNIDLRKEYDEFMTLHGYWAVLRKKMTGANAATYNTSTEEGAFKQSQVLRSGQGWVDYLVRVRRMTLTDALERATSLGLAGASLVRFYVRFNQKPDPHDFLIEIAQSESSLRSHAQIQPILPLVFTQFWDIQEVTPMRDRGGRVEFWQVLVKESTLGDIS